MIRKSVVPRSAQAALGFVVCGAVLAPLWACGPSVDFTSAEVEQYQALSPLPAVPASPTNRHADDPLAARLGQRLFFEKSWAGALRVSSDLGTADEVGKVSCFSCHSGPALHDQRSVPANVSLAAGFHSRNSPALVNSSFYKWTNWAGRFDAPWSLPPAVLESPVIFNSSRLRVAHVVFDKYRADYDALFDAKLDPALGGDPRFPPVGKPKLPATNPQCTATPPAAGCADGAWEAMADADRAQVNRVMANVGKALEAYVRTLTSREAPFDRFVAGDERALGISAQRGLKLFLGKAQCVTCHAGPHFSDDGFHNIGVAQTGEHVPPTDLGLFQDRPPLLSSPFNGKGAFSDDAAAGEAKLTAHANPDADSDKGKFRTPGLRGIALTAPYMHSGQLATLAEVVDYYNRGGEPPAVGTLDPAITSLGLTPEEVQDLVAFLESLTGAPPPADLLRDTSAP